ncbi:hypothetical protein [Streptomyces prunicolor]|uniref:hypothetical protein n=1 Tax=Streptomyces prunicolor TaxID=67348 RepID=UPI000371ABC2|nr:hypothetical protein [Streptomyces prunicolor]
MGIGATAGVAAVGGIALSANASSSKSSSSSPSSDTLVFDPDAYTKLTKTVTDTALTVAANLDNLGDDVNHIYYWDEGHGANTDPGDFITWIAQVTGHKAKRGK